MGKLSLELHFTLFFSSSMFVGWFCVARSERSTTTTKWRKVPTSSNASAHKLQKNFQLYKWEFPRQHCASWQFHGTVEQFVSREIEKKIAVVFRLILEMMSFLLVSRTHYECWTRPMGPQTAQWLYIYSLCVFREGLFYGSAIARGLLRFFFVGI